MAAGLCCTQWFSVFWSTAVWSRLIVTGDTMCSWQYSITTRDYEVTE